MTHFVEASGNLLKADVDALVNTVNTVGVMGKGIALQFKKAFPANFKAYEKACKNGKVELGSMFIVDNGQLTTPRWIINFPTKGHWRSKSRLAAIEQGLDDLALRIQELEISSIAIPPLGCGNGGLDWPDVEKAIHDRLAGLPVAVHLFAPAGAPAASDMANATERPNLTPGKAALVHMLHRYSQLSFGASLVEVQKLMYFLQESGQKLRLNYEKGHYGPYAHNLNHVLIRLEGHHLKGYGDGSQRVQDSEPIVVMPGASAEAEEAIRSFTDPGLGARIEQTLALAEGFESAYGLELLASVHWCATNETGVTTPEAAAACVRSWTRRKQRMFTPKHVETAWNHLVDHGWLQNPDREPSR